ncbi:MAG: nuclear transport factor 2 family protein [Actinobacteria bacterium]|jgi:ketosteroid isomerase-like protein|nr:MAG: nuclear transport factor 2 family protein [Actinomycetota bacterium]
MAESNVDVVRQGFEALRDGDPEALMPFIHPEFEATTPPQLAAEPDTYRGPDGIRRYFESFYESMDRVSFDAQEFIPVGDRVVVDAVLRTRGRTTGIETEQRSYMVWELKDGKAYRVSVYATLDEAVAKSAGAD